MNDGRRTSSGAAARALRALARVARRKPLGFVGLAVLAVVAAAAAFPDAFAGAGPIDQDVPNRLRPPGAGFLFGTDGAGRDVFSRVVHGARATLYVGVLAVLVSTLAGTAAGASSAVLGGGVDLVVQRLVDAMLGVPFMVLAVVVVVSLGPSANAVAGALAVAYAPQVARLARAAALAVLVEPYVLAARLEGAGAVRVALRHVLPNIYSPVLAQAAGFFGSAMVAESVLSFLGLGVPPPDPSWGRMVQEGSRLYLESAPWLTVIPGLVLTATVLSFLFVGDALRDLIDPRDARGTRARATARIIR